MDAFLEACLMFAFLSSPDHRIRESCQLEKASEWAVALLCNCADLEVRLRASREANRRKDWVSLRLADPASLPWISALPVDWPDRNSIIQNYVMAAHRAGTWNAHGIYHGERIATGMYLATLPRVEAAKLLQRMPMSCYWSPGWKSYTYDDQGGGYKEEDMEGTWKMCLGWSGPWGWECETFDLPKECWPK